MWDQQKLISATNHPLYPLKKERLTCCYPLGPLWHHSSRHFICEYYVVQVKLLMHQGTSERLLYLVQEYS